jgi:hypothetical protein
MQFFSFIILSLISFLDNFYLCTNILVEVVFYLLNNWKDLLMKRIIALTILVIPGVLAGYGIKLMRDMTFGILQPPIPFLWLQFIIGMLLFIGGLGFVAGFIFHRDRKQNKVQNRFKKIKKET